MDSASNIAPAPLVSRAAAAKIARLSAPASTRPKRVSIDAYYAPTEGKEGVDLLRALHDVISTGYKTRTYDKARHMDFAVVDDLDGDNVVSDVYTGRRYEGISGLRTATTAGLTTEHAWPQSKGATEEARSDMHHLFVAAADVNTMRSNNRYDVVESAEWSTAPDDRAKEISLLGTSDVGDKVWEPRASMRGDLARAQLYFFTRWHGDRPKRYSLNDFRESLPTLLEWNREDPPDEAERARNEAIYRLQGNRNPYVDHPGYVDRIGFSESMLRRPMHRRSRRSGT